MKTVLITGGARGIGRHLVKKFAANGYCVSYSYNSSNEQSALLNGELERMGSKHLSFKVDVANESDIKNWVNETVNAFGRIDVLINNAGTFEDGLLPDMELDSWKRVVDTNLTGAFLCAKHSFPIMQQQGYGRIISIGSVMGETGIYGSCSYAATKAAIIGLSKSIALEGVKFGITSNVVSLGYINEGMTGALSPKVYESAIRKIPMKKTGDPDCLAKIILDLCQDEFSYVTGQVIRVNGGLYM